MWSGKSIERTVIHIITTGTRRIRRIIRQYLLPITIENLSYTQVFINGIYEGSTKDPKRLVDTVRYTRRSGQFAKDMSVTLSEQIHISTTSGRICRPLLIVKDNKCVYQTLKNRGRMSFNELLTAGAIEYLDCEEEDTMLVAFFTSDLKKKIIHTVRYPMQ